jgi:hypothetical protein
MLCVAMTRYRFLCRLPKGRPSSLASSSVVALVFESLLQGLLDVSCILLFLLLLQLAPQASVATAA